jgi:hypothetical protein
VNLRLYLGRKFTLLQLLGTVLQCFSYTSSLDPGLMNADEIYLYNKQVFGWLVGW